MIRTKIICTLGPASNNKNVIGDMIEAGMNIARINLSHGSHEEHMERISILRQMEEELGANIALMLDTKGPEIRIGDFEREKIHLEKGQEFTLTTRPVMGNEHIVFVNYDKLPEIISKGNTILLSDGLIELRVLKVDENDVLCTVKNNGEIKSRQGLNIPGKILPLPAVTQKDLEDILFAIKIKADFIAASFVRKAADIIEVKEILEENGGYDIQVIAKIENREGVDNIDEILRVADAIMIARGDLGVEIPVEEVPMIQKRIINKCNLVGKPVITATQMLDSMIRTPRPTRAEATDVANAIYDGTDAIMLSGETAAGLYPVETIQTMVRIASRTEQSYYESNPLRAKTPVDTITDAISYATCDMAKELKAKAIITSTKSGYTAKAVAKYRPSAPILAVTPREDVMKNLQIVRGVYPIKSIDSKTTDEMFKAAIEAALKSEIVKKGDLVIITAGVPANISGTTNLIRVHVVGDVILKGIGIGTRPVFGEVFVAKTYREAFVMPENAILVIKSTDKSLMPVLKRASAIITEEGGITCHAAIAGIELDIPVIVGARGATELLDSSYEVTMDPQRGLVYFGDVTIK